MSGTSIRRHRKRKIKAEINVVPYIDVMLVLLVIFMITAPLLTLGVDVDLPKSDAKSLESKQEPIVVSVDAKGNYFLAKKPGENRAVTREMLDSEIRSIVTQNEKGKLQVYIAGEGSANYQKIFDAMQILQGAGVENVGLMSQPSQRSGGQ